jgi:hypothetical protein
MDLNYANGLPLRGFEAGSCKQGASIAGKELIRRRTLQMKPPSCFPRALLAAKAALVRETVRCRSGVSPAL